MRRLLILTATIILCFSLTSCSLIENNSSSTKNTEIIRDAEGNIIDNGPVPGGVLKLFSTKPDTLNPILTKNIFVNEFCSLIFEGLFKIDKEQKLIPALAKDYEVSSDGLTWTFYLKDNIEWHNHTPLTAEDVKFTVDTIQDSKINTIYKDNLQNVAMNYVVDDKTFRVVLKSLNSFTADLMTFPIISKKYYSGKGIYDQKSKVNMKPLGTGPYKYESGGSSKKIVLSANRNWWNSNPKDNKSSLKLPYISEVDIIVYKSSSDADSAFQQGDIDVAYLDSNSFDKYIGRGNLKMRKYPSKSYDFVVFNLSDQVLKDKAVRQAIAYALERSKIINDSIAGGGVISDLPLIPGTWLHENYYTHSSKKALEILKKAGWKLEGGIFYKHIYGYSIPLRFEIIVNDDNLARCKAAEEISSQLKNIGMDVSVKKINWNVEQNELRLNRFDMALIGCNISSVSDLSFGYSSYEISAGLNIAKYKNTDVDFYLDQILTQINAKDTVNKKDLYSKVEDIILDEVPSIGLYFYNNAVVYNKRISGELEPYAWNRLSDVTKWYISNEKQ